MSVSFAHITFDAVDALALSAFWSQAIGQDIDDGAEETLSRRKCATSTTSHPDVCRPWFGHASYPPEANVALGYRPGDLLWSKLCSTTLRDPALRFADPGVSLWTCQLPFEVCESGDNFWGFVGTVTTSNVDLLQDA